VKTDIIQTSFVGGEFAPALYGRTDIAQYANACSIVENFLIRPFGSVISCAGTEYINECKTGGSTGLARLMRFVFSQTDSYVIEMGVGYFRFYTDGAVVVSNSTIYEVAHTYEEDELFDIQYSQLNDVIYLSHPDHRTQKLTRLASNNWTLTDFDFLGGPFMDDNTNTATTITVSATAGTVDVTVSPTDANLFTVSGATIGHTNSYWKIGLPVTDSTTGLDVQGYVKLTNIVNTYTATGTVMSLLSTTGATSIWAEGSWSAVRGYPARNTFHQRRLCFARTAAQPQNIWASQNFVYDQFAVNSGEDDDALNIQLASNESNDIKWLASGAALLAGTYGGEFIIASGDDSPLTPSNTNARKETSWGSESIVPAKIGNFFYYIQRFKEKMRELFYFWDYDNYKSVDKTILSPHIAGGGFVEFAYQQVPDTILWCVCTDGTIATLTREVDQEVQGWARQTTSGSYLSIASIPAQSGSHDEVWVIVERTINGTARKYVERFKSQEIPDRQDQCFYVHSGLTYDAYTAYTTTTITLSATAGTAVTVTSSAAHFAANDIGQRIRAIDADGATLGELEITNYTSSTVVAGEVKTNFDTTAYAANRWGVSVTNITGLSHLETSSVVVLADGGTDKPNKTVTSGGITLANDYFVVNVGLPYTQILQTLPPEAGSQRGTSQGKIQKINEVGFKVNRSHKGFKVGGDSTLVERVQFRDPTTDMGTPELLYTGTIPNVVFRDDYRYGSKVRIENPDPLPIELLSIITSVDTNDK